MAYLFIFHFCRFADEVHPSLSEESRLIFCLSVTKKVGFHPSSQGSRSFCPFPEGEFVCLLLSSLGLLSVSQELVGCLFFVWGFRETPFFSFLFALSFIILSST